MANNCRKFAHHACHARVVFETQFTLLVIGCRNFVKQSCNLLRLKAKKECQSSLYLKSSVLLHGFQRSISMLFIIVLSGRYEIKVYQTYLFFHGKSYDYKIPLKTITRMFLLPHKDGRHMFFVLHINPPIRQGQTRYPFLVLEFSKDEEIEVELGLTEYVMVFDRALA